MEVPLRLQAELFAMRQLLSRLLSQFAILIEMVDKDHMYADRNLFLNHLLEATIRDIEAAEFINRDESETEILREMIKDRLSTLITQSSRK